MLFRSFISVGMSADISLLLKSPWMVLGLTVLLITLKAPVLYFVGRISGGLDKASALRLGVVLAAGRLLMVISWKVLTMSFMRGTRTRGATEKKGRNYI